MEGDQEPEDLFSPLSSGATLGKSHDLFEHPSFPKGRVTLALPSSWGRGEACGRRVREAAASVATPTVYLALGFPPDPAALPEMQPSALSQRNPPVSCP